LVSPSLALLQGGRTAFKDALGHAHVPDPSTLSWRTAVLTYLLGQADAGRRLILATAAPSRFAECVAGHLGCFETVLSSNPHRNIKGERKVEAIRAHIGPIPFDYAGDSWTDLPVFAAARQGIVVSREEAFIRRVGELTRIEKIFRE
jgi:phosphoserine phosphatase